MHEFTADLDRIDRSQRHRLELSNKAGSKMFAQLVSAASRHAAQPEIDAIYLFREARAHGFVKQITLTFHRIMADSRMGRSAPPHSQDTDTR